MNTPDISINLHLAVPNPNSMNLLTNVNHYDGNITEHIGWEANSYIYDNNWAELSFDIGLGNRNHPGISIEFGLCGYLFEFKIYSDRHWDEINGN